MQFQSERTDRPDIRQQHDARQRRVIGDVSKPGRDDRLRRFTFNQRRAERRIRMRPADQDRQTDAIAPRFDTRRKETEQLARRGAGPHQHRPGAGAEHRGCFERESRFVENVGLERPRGKVLPLIYDGKQFAEASPLDSERIGGVTSSHHSAARARDRRRGTIRGNTRLGFCCCSRHARASAILGSAENQAMNAETIFRNEEKCRRFEHHGAGAGEGGAIYAEVRNKQDANQKISRNEPA